MRSFEHPEHGAAFLGSVDTGEGARARHVPADRRAGHPGGAGACSMGCCRSPAIGSARSARSPRSASSIGACPSMRCSPFFASPSRMFISLGFTLVYGYVAAYNAQGRAVHDSAAGHAAVHSGPQLSSGRHAVHGRAFPDQATGRGTGLDPADLHRAGVEHDLQLLFLAEEHSAGDDGGGAGLSVELVADGSANWSCRMRPWA